jgi:uncharacterized protein YndB with AHSA1/START domain
MIVIERTTMIDRPAREVFDYVSDPSNDSRWQADIIETKRPEGALKSGSTFEWLVKFMGKRKTPVEVVKLEPNTIFQIRVISGPPFGLRPVVTYSFEPTNGGTKLTRLIQAQPSGMGVLMSPMMKTMIGNYSTKYLKTLKGILENER